MYTFDHALFLTLNFDGGPVMDRTDANMVKTDFFEARSTAYAKSTALIDDL